MGGRGGGSPVQGRSRLAEPAAALTPEAAIRNAYKDLAAEPGAWVSLTRLRAALPDISRGDMDNALRMLNRMEDVGVVPESNQKALTPADRAAAVHFGGQDKHLIVILPR